MDLRQTEDIDVKIEELLQDVARKVFQTDTKTISAIKIRKPNDAEFECGIKRFSLLIKEKDVKKVAEKIITNLPPESSTYFKRIRVSDNGWYLKIDRGSEDSKLEQSVANHESQVESTVMTNSEKTEKIKVNISSKGESILAMCNLTFLTKFNFFF